MENKGGYALVIYWILINTQNLKGLGKLNISHQWGLLFHGQIHKLYSILEVQTESYGLWKNYIKIKTKCKVQIWPIPSQCKQTGSTGRGSFCSYCDIHKWLTEKEKKLEVCFAFGYWLDFDKCTSNKFKGLKWFEKFIMSPKRSVELW